MKFDINLENLVPGVLEVTLKRLRTEIMFWALSSMVLSNDTSGSKIGIVAIK